MPSFLVFTNVRLHLALHCGDSAMVATAGVDATVQAYKTRTLIGMFSGVVRFSLALST